MIPRWYMEAALLGSTFAQTKVKVPSDLASGFDPGSIILQVNYDNAAEFGFQDGSQFTQQATATTPVFALGDASGINTAIKFLMMMVDTTTSSRVLHFLQPDFQTNGDETGISSSSIPAFAYAAPGALGETGSRQYSWLLYQQIGTFAAKDVPSPGQTMDVEAFQSANDLKPALAGVVMVVNSGNAAVTTSVTAVESSGQTSSVVVTIPSVQTSTTAPPPAPVVTTASQIIISTPSATGFSTVGSQSSLPAAVSITASALPESTNDVPSGPKSSASALVIPGSTMGETSTDGTKGTTSPMLAASNTAVSPSSPSSSGVIALSGAKSFLIKDCVMEYAFSLLSCALIAWAL
ncbi:hypothetical protein MMC25_002133 [Agyrium rufum]|nr:hypothetical protein [Agyrium rufum]